MKLSILVLILALIQTIKSDNSTNLPNTTMTSVVLPNSTTTTVTTTTVTEKLGKPYHHRSAPRLPKQINNPNQLAIDLENKLDDTIIGAIVMGSIFLFITLSVTITVIIFCLKKNTVFVFQKSEQDDNMPDNNYDDTLSCHSNNFFNQNHRYFINNYRNPAHFQSLFTTTPITNNLSSTMTHTNINHRPITNHNSCQCCCNKSLPPPCAFFNNNPEIAPWHKLHTQAKFKPMFSQINNEPITADVTNNSNNENLNSKVQMSNNLNIKFDYINNKRAIHRKQSDNDIDISVIHRVTQPESMSPLLSHHEISTPLGKSQTYQELKPLQSSPSTSNNDNTTNNDNKRQLQKSQSNYDSTNILKETREF